jgi:hypothetical protein
MGASRAPCTSSETLVGDSAWPGLALERHALCHTTGEEPVAVVSGGTSLNLAWATLERVRAMVRGQWQMEHTSYGGRAVLCDEDRAQVRCGTMPHVMGAVHHTTMGLLRREANSGQRIYRIISICAISQSHNAAIITSCVGLYIRVSPCNCNKELIGIIHDSQREGENDCRLLVVIELLHADRSCCKSGDGGS